MKKTATVLILSLTCAGALAQQKKTEPASAPASPAPATEQAAPQDAPPAPKAAAPKAPDRASAYYHYAMAHIFEELVVMYGRTEYGNRAIEEYKLALENDPDSSYLSAGLAELYAKTGRIRDAVLEAQEIIKKNPNNLDARKLLGRIYLRSLGDVQGGQGSNEMLRLAIQQYEQIVRIDPTSVEDHVLLGRLYRMNNELLKAEQEFKTAISIDPDSEDAVTTLAYLYNEEGNTAKAAQVLSSVPDAARTAKLYMALGYTYEQQKEYKKAVDAYRKATDQDKDNLDAVRGLAQNLLNDGQAEAALEQFKVIADSDPQDTTTLVRMADIYRRNGKFDAGLDVLKKAEALVQDSIEIPYNRALIYEAQGRYDEAAVILNQLANRKPAGSTPSNAERNNRAVFLERLGTVYREAGKTQLAVEAFRKMLDLGDENVARGYDQLIETYRDAKQWQDATNTAQEAVGRLPQNRAMKLVLAGQMADSGKSEEAVAQVKAMLKGAPEDREVYIALAQIQSRLRHWPEAEEAIAKALDLSKKQEEKDYAAFIQGSIYERQKKYESAEEAFKRVIASDPNSAMALNYLGYMLADRGVRLDEALGYIKKAVELDPQNGAYLDSLGWVYYKMGNYELAEDNLRKASEKINNDATIQDHLGDLFNKTGRLKLAAAHWERALEEWNRSVAAEVDNNDVAKVQKKLESAKTKLAQQQSSVK
ncbi:MAG TPA: tetratricopeptide repeat protein [Terriglobales bacterium]|nr:tetratricopeptide repeat protein [Terriglobales bacterium]